MFKLEETTLFATPVSKEELEYMLENLGGDGVLGAMLMLNFVAKQYKEGNIE